MSNMDMHKMHTTPSIPLTPAQAVRIHGWTNPYRRLYWTTVVEREDLTFSALVHKMGGNTPQNLNLLHLLQPHVHEWVRLKKIDVQDCELMHKYWDIHPLRDFGTDVVKIGELLQAGLSFDALMGCRVKVDDLFRAGMTADVMMLFRFSFQQWLDLGLQKRHVENMTTAQVERVFSLTKNTLEASLF